MSRQFPQDGQWSRSRTVLGLPPNLSQKRMKWAIVPVPTEAIVEPLQAANEVLGQFATALLEATIAIVHPASHRAALASTTQPIDLVRTLLRSDFRRTRPAFLQQTLGFEPTEK